MNVYTLEIEVDIPVTGRAMLVYNAEVDRLCHGCMDKVLKATSHECGLCIKCCRCTHCPGCMQVTPLRTCGACHGCANCCRCIACNGCGMIYANIERICNKCGGGKECECCFHAPGSRSAEGLRIRRKVNLLRYVPGPTDCVRNPIPRLVAAEVEVCGFNINTVSYSTMCTIMEAWNISAVSDGSLPSGGIEFNTHPAGGDLLVEQMTNLCAGLAAAKAYITSSAGCHIHVDCRDFGYFDLAKLLRVVACVEAGLYSIIPSFRAWSEQYCRFWAPQYLLGLHDAESCMGPGDTDRRRTLLYRKYILDKLYGYHTSRSVNEAKQNKHGSGRADRYRGTNVHSFVHRGTIEFRMPPGTVLADNIINWGILLAGLCEYAKHSTMPKVVERCKELEEPTLQIVGKKYKQLPAAYIESSYSLLHTLAPNAAVRDWLADRRKWAKKHTIAEDFWEGHS